MDEKRAGKVDAKVAALGKQLEGRGWQAVVRAHDKDSRTVVYLRWVDDVVQGVVAMHIDDHGRAAFVNVVGELDPEQIGRLGARFDIDGLDRVKIDLEAKRPAPKAEARPETGAHRQ